MLQVGGGLHSPFGNTWCALFRQTLDEWLGPTVYFLGEFFFNLFLPPVFDVVLLEW